MKFTEEEWIRMGCALAIALMAIEDGTESKENYQKLFDKVMGGIVLENQNI